MSTREKVLMIAERMIRDKGYGGFSFREIAAEIGIKSASIHHHFATKEALVNTVIADYSERFFTHLPDAENSDNSLGKLLNAYAESYIQAFAPRQCHCLCGMLMSEAHILTEKTQDLLREFAMRNTTWLNQMLSRSKAPLPEDVSISMASTIFASFEGAMSLAALATTDAPLYRAARVWRAQLL